MTAEPENPLKVFYSYARKDEKLRNELGKHLFSLKRQGLMQDWYDRDISAGKEWAQEIATHLDTSQIILLLISPDFIASDYCYGIEMQRALEKHEAGEARVIPILLRPVEWQDTPLKKLQTLPKNAKAVTRWNSKEEAFVEVARGIREVVKELKPLASPTPPQPTAAKEEVIIPSSASLSSPPITMQEDQNSMPELPPIWHVPHRRNPFFTGREEIFERLRHAFTDMPATSSQPRILSGLGGMGKTQIAIEYAYRYRDDYRTVLWAKADSLEVLNSDFATIGGLLNLSGQREQDQKYAVDIVKRRLEVNTNWLLILDNVEDLKMVIDYLPPAPKGHILLTSQTQVAGGVAFRLEIEKMTAEEGALFLLHRTNLLAQGASPESVPEADRKKAREVVEMMDGLPLAIDQAGAYIEETGCSLAGYLELYAKRRVELLKLRGGLAPDHPKPVATTWSLSFEKIEQTKPASAELMRFFAFLHPDAIPEELVLKGASLLGSLLKTVASDTLTLNETIGELLKYSLVRRNPEAMLTVHRLVQSVLKDTMSTEAQHQWAERTVRAVNQAFPDAEFNAWDDCRRYLPQAQVCAALIEQESMAFPEAARLLNEAGHYLYKQGQYSEAEPLLEQAIAIRKQTLGPEHPEVATSLNHLAELYREQGKYAPAEILYQQALTIREKLLGPEHVDLATSLNNLGLLYDILAKYALAKQLHQRALEMRRNLLGTEHSDVATSLNNLAELYKTEGLYIQARPLLLQTLEIKEQALGPDHPDTATSLNNLARLYQDEGQYALARPLFQRALTIREKVLGPQHPDTASSLNNLASFYQDEGQYALARPLYQRALTIREKVLGPEHPDTATSLNNLALLYRDEGQYALARPLFQRALTIREKVLGPQHPDTANSLNSLAGFYAKQHNYAQAETLFQRALSICERTLGPKHPRTINVLKNYAIMLRQAKRNAKAKDLEKRITAMEEKRAQDDKS